MKNKKKDKIEAIVFSRRLQLFCHRLTHKQTEAFENNVRAVNLGNWTLEPMQFFRQRHRKKCG